MAEPPQLPDLDDRDLTGLIVREAVLDQARLIGVVMRDAEIDGLIGNLVVNGVEVTAYVEAELDRRHPERLLMRSDDLDELREAWAMLQRHWAGTIERLRRLGEDAAQTRVAGEWSAIETVRHLVFVVDTWLRQFVDDRPVAFHPWGLTAAFMQDGQALGLDPDAGPTLEEILAVNDERIAFVQGVLDRASPADLTAAVRQSDDQFWPAPQEGRTLLDCLHVVLDEEWAHHQFCVRDLDAIEVRRVEP